MVPRTRTITYGSRSFAVSGPRVWNDLPPTLRASSTTLGQFQSRLKTTLFRLACGMWLGAFVTVKAVRIAPYKCSNLITYLLTHLLTYVVGSFPDGGRMGRQHAAESARRRPEETTSSESWATRSRERRAAEEKGRRRKDAENAERAGRTTTGLYFSRHFFDFFSADNSLLAKLDSDTVCCLLIHYAPARTVTVAFDCPLRT